MTQLQTTQPQLHGIISQNPQAFFNLIMGGDPNVGMGGAGMGGGMGGGADPPGTIRVTREEMDAIDRLTQLGFPKHKAAEAYFACDKNEEMAANYLFENGFEDDDFEGSEQPGAPGAAGANPPAAQNLGG